MNEKVRKQPSHKHIFHRGKGRYPIRSTFLYRPLPSSQPCRVRQAQSSNTAQEPVESTLVKVRGLPEMFLEKIETENVETKKEMETRVSNPV